MPKKKKKRVQCYSCRYYSAPRTNYLEGMCDYIGHTGRSRRWTLEIECPLLYPEAKCAVYKEKITRR